MKDQTWSVAASCKPPFVFTGYISSTVRTLLGFKNEEKKHVDGKYTGDIPVHNDGNFFKVFKFDNIIDIFDSAENSSDAYCC